MPQRLADLASHVGGDLHGNGELMISRVASLESARAGDISFIIAPRLRPALAACRASAVILAPALKDATELPRVVCENPYAAYARIAQLFSPVAAPVAGIHPTAVVEAGAQIAPGAAVGAGVFIGRDAVIGEGTQVGAGTSIGAGSRVGSGCLLHARVTVYHGCMIGDRCIIHSGAVIGADGFGFAPDKGSWLKIPQTGCVRVGDDVEIGANTTIDRGALDDTVIENGVKLDNQIQVAHNVRIGAHTVIAAMTGIAGSARIGSHCLIGGAVRIMGHISIADRVEIGATTFVSKSINASGKYSGGVPFAATSAWLKNEAWMKNLDKLAERLKALEQRVLERKPGDRQKRD